MDERSRDVCRLGAIAGAALMVACGDYVRYEREPPGAGGPGAGTLDEATRTRLMDTDHLDHLALESVLAAYVRPPSSDGQVYFDYAALAASDEAQLLLDQYVATLDAVSPENLADRSERLAYWINGYNAHVIRAVIYVWGGKPEYSVSEGGFILFDLAHHGFGGELYTLNEVEHAIIRGDESHAAFTAAPEVRRQVLRGLHASLWEGQPLDARIHVALNCASISCPNLPASSPHVLRAATLEAQLDAAARAFAEDPRKGAGPEGVSQLFGWFAEDFEPVYGNAAGFLRRHRAGGLDGVNLDRYLPYDWSLNILP